MSRMSESLLVTHPILAQEWHPTKNGILTPNDVTAGSGKKVWWLLPYDDPETGKHFDFEWEATVSNRAKNNSGCPYIQKACKKVWLGFNDLESKYPDLAKEWHTIRNGGLTPRDVTWGCNKKVWWLLPYDDPKTGKHFDFEWQATVGNRTGNNTGCPFLSPSAQAIMPGFNDLATTHPEIAKEWHPSKNGNLRPTDIGPGTHKKVWWLLPYDDPKTGKHFDFEWQAKVNNRTSSNSGCPYLGKSPSAVMKGFNDLETTAPLLLNEWDYEKNTILPSEVTSGSELNVYWKGKCGHTYKQMIYNHYIGAGCPICSSRQVLKGYNDLAHCYPEVATEWNWEKNKLHPDEVTAHTPIKVWWICKFGHSFYASIGARTGMYKTGCPTCAKEAKTSFPEQTIFYYLNKVVSDAISNDRRYSVELDIYLEKENTAIEFDGLFWHRNKNAYIKDNKKDGLCKEKGIRLIRFRDKSLQATESAEIIWINERDGSDMERALKELFTLLSIPCPDINIERDTADIYSQYVFKQKEKSLKELYPSIAEEWCFEKNGFLTPENVNAGSGKRIWWKCKDCGTEWRCKVVNRTNEQHQGCPSCTREKVRKTKSTRVINVDTGQVFDSITKAAESVSGRFGDISACCSGKQKTAFGFHWKYYNKPQTSRKPYKGRVKNISNGMIFNSLQEAANWCSGRVMNISACCRGRQKTAYGYVWKFEDRE